MDSVLVMGSPFLYMVFSVWRVTFLRCCSGGLPIGECDEWRTCWTLVLLFGVVMCGCETNSNDEEPLSHGDRDDSVLHEE